MYCEIAFSSDAFERLIKYRMADLFRPLPTPVPYPEGVTSWLDGFLVTGISFNHIGSDQYVLVNELASPSSVRPTSYGYNASAVAMDLSAAVYFARVEDVANAGLTQPTATITSIPTGLIRIFIRASVGADGIPQLQMQLDTPRLASLNLPTEVMAQLVAASSSTFPFDIGAQFRDLFPAGNGSVLNAGITRDEGGSIVLRFTFPGTVWQSALAHSYEWQNFHSATFNAHLGVDDWRLDLDGGAVALGLAAMVNPSFQDSKPISFDASWIDAHFINGAVPRVVITKTGRVENACAGNDVRFDAFANVDFTVPSDNLLRGTLSFDFDKNDWDVAKCFGLTMLNPLSVFITAVDQGQFGIGLAELALSFVYPTKPVLAIVALEFLILGYDQTFANGVIEDRLKDIPLVTKLPGGFAVDRTIAARNDLTNDWLVLRNCVGSAGRLLLGGELRVPDAILPRLTPSDLEGFSKWVLADRCSPGKGQVARGSLALSVTPGYGANPGAVPPPRFPTIPLRMGIAGGMPLFEVLNDSLGIFQDPSTDYRQVDFRGVPGQVEVMLKASTVRLDRFKTFAESPYPLRLRFYSNAGVREYQFKAPEVLTDFTESLADMAERINRCMLRGSSLLLRKYLELKWRVDPPDVLRDLIAQQWEVHVRGLAPGRKATVWNLDTGAPLMHAHADHTGRVDVALLLRGEQRATALLVALDDEPFRRSEPEWRETDGAGEGNPAVVAMQQSLLTQVDVLRFEERIASINFANSTSGNTLLINTELGRQFARRLPSPFTSGSASPVSADGLDVRGTARRQRGLAVWRGEQRHFIQLSEETARTEVLAEYRARSAFDVASGSGSLIAQVSSDGHEVRLFHKGVPVQFGSHDWREDPEQASA